MSMSMKAIRENIFAALLGAVVAGAGGWIAFGRDVVTRQELDAELGRVESTLAETKTALKQLLEAHVQLMVEVKLTSQKVDRLLEK